MERSVLVLFAHPALERSRIHRRLLQAPRSTPGVELRDLYQLYPDLDVEVSAEQEAVERHDVLVFQHPVYWYSAPPLLKQWQDLVLEHGWAYGPDGHALEGKLAVHVVSTGGSANTYGRKGRNRFTLNELMRPFEQTADTCGMDWLPAYAVHGTHKLTEVELRGETERYRRLLEALRDDRIALDAARNAGNLATVFEELKPAAASERT